MPSTLHIAVVTPEGKLMEADAASVTFPAYDGLMGVLPGRAALLTRIGVGTLTVITESTRQFFIRGGFAQMRDYVLTLLTNEAATPEQLTTQAAQAELAKAEALPNLTDAQHATRAEAIAAAKAKLALAQGK